MRRARLVLIAGLFAFFCALNVYAADKTEAKAPDKQDQLRQEIKSLSQQADQLETEISKIEAPAKPLHKQLNSLRKKIKADKEELKDIRREESR
jgi:peptidoglycan hydrolase CwlO-like protein